jgi:hypothetical protein
MPLNEKQLELLQSGQLNNTTSNHSARLLQDAAQFDPSIVGKMKRWQEFYQPGGRENNLLDRLIAESQGGPESRLPEKVIFSAAQGDEAAITMMQADDQMRSVFTGELLGELDQAKFEKFRHDKRQKPAVIDGLLNEPKPAGGSLRQFGENIGKSRQDLLDALSTKPR